MSVARLGKWVELSRCELYTRYITSWRGWTCSMQLGYTELQTPDYITDYHLDTSDLGIPGYLPDPFSNECLGARLGQNSTDKHIPVDLV